MSFWKRRHYWKIFMDEVTLHFLLNEIKIIVSFWYEDCKIKSLKKLNKFSVYKL